MTATSTETPRPDALLGEPSAADDWKLAPGVHAAKLDAKAAALKRVLEDEAVTEIMRRYDRHDQAAIGYQKSYKDFGWWEIILGAAAAILGAVVLSMTDAGKLTQAQDALRIGLLVVQVVCAAGVVGFKYLLRRRRPFIKWQEARSAAETARIELFDTVCGLTERKWADAERTGGFPLLPLQLEYFVRYQLMVQLAYYDKRGRQHQMAADRYMSFGAFVTFLSALAIALVGLLQDLGDTVSVASMAALVAPILMTTQTNLSRLNQDERNAARYAITFEHLERLRGRLGHVRRSAADGDAEAVRAFIRAANDVISVEHSQWNVQQSTQSATEPRQ